MGAEKTSIKKKSSTLYGDKKKDAMKSFQKLVRARGRGKGKIL